MERMEQRLELLQSEVCSTSSAAAEATRSQRLESELQNSQESRRHLELSLKRIEQELISTADAWAEHEARLASLECESTASAEAHERHRLCFDKLANQLTSSSDLWRQLERIQQEQKESLQVCAKQDDRISRFSDSDMEVRSRIERTERELGRVSAIEKELKQLSAAHGTVLSEDLSELRNRIARQDKLLSQKEAAMDDMKRQFENLASDFTRDRGRSLEVQERNEGHLGQLSGQIAMIGEVKNRLELFERDHGQSLEAHTRHEKRFSLISDEIASMSQSKARLDRLERDLSLSAEAHGKHEGRFESLSGDMQRIQEDLNCRPDSHSHFRELRSQFTEMSKQQHQTTLDALEKSEAALAQDHEWLKESVKDIANALSKVQETTQRVQVEVQPLPKLSAQLERMQRELELSAESHGSHESRFKHLDTKTSVLEEFRERLKSLETKQSSNLRAHDDQQGSLERNISETTVLAERQKIRLEQLEKTLKDSLEQQGKHGVSLERLIGEVASQDGLQDRVNSIERELVSAQQNKARLDAQLKEFRSETSATSDKHIETERQLKEIRDEVRHLDLDRRLRQNFHDVERRLDENQKVVEAELQKTRSTVEQDMSTLQRRASAELRIEVRTAIRNEAAAVAALDEQLWLTDQRLSQRIDEVEKMASSSRSSPPRKAAQVVMKPTTPVRYASGAARGLSAPSTQRVGSSAAAALAKRAADSVSDTSDTDLAQHSGVKKSTIGMVSVAADALTRNIDIRRRSSGGSSRGSCSTSSPKDRSGMDDYSPVLAFTSPQQDTVVELVGGESAQKPHLQRSESGYSFTPRQRKDAPAAVASPSRSPEGITKQKPQTAGSSKLGALSVAHSAAEALASRGRTECNFEHLGVPRGKHPEVGSRSCSREAPVPGSPPKKISNTLLAAARALAEEDSLMS
eukprot:TRINITY_DN22750_c0_g1_i1.p1 TRINITY_DN22750_c0_g1~~TRINITY_DN22750_c0_g1_i1.p1  ORF type:complete len:1048 (+),score=226.39 TRINITY_DN22750_c0_g1_i1:382-3144(+)